MLDEQEQSFNEKMDQTPVVYKNQMSYDAQLGDATLKSDQTLNKSAQNMTTSVGGSMDNVNKQEVEQDNETNEFDGDQFTDPLPDQIENNDLSDVA